MRSSNDITIKSKKLVCLRRCNFSEEVSIAYVMVVATPQLTVAVIWPVNYVPIKCYADWLNVFKVLVGTCGECYRVRIAISIVTTEFVQSDSIVNWIAEETSWAKLCNESRLQGVKNITFLF